MRKVLFFDIDGTLINSCGQMPDSTRYTLKKLQENGHLTVICSGRPICQMDTWLLDMKFNGIIGSSGAYVECNGQIIYEHHLEGNVLSTACALLEGDGALYWAQTKDGIIVTENIKKCLLDRFRSTKIEEDTERQIFKDLQVDEYLAQRQDIEKLNYINSCMSVAEFQKQLLEYCDVTKMSYENPTDNSGEISSKGINKALGIQKYIEYIGMARENTIAFGDGPNDFEMLEYVGMGIAMGNAVSALKECADYVTTKIDEGGIEHAIRKLGLLHSD